MRYDVVAEDTYLEFGAAHLELSLLCSDQALDQPRSAGEQGGPQDGAHDVECPSPTRSSAANPTDAFRGLFGDGWDGFHVTRPTRP